MLLARRATLHLLYEGTDITADITKDLDTATWTDKSNKEADDLSISLHNVHGKWSNEWLPSKGAKLTASIEIVNWGGQGNNVTLPCGTFEIDEISLSGDASGGSRVTIQAISTPITSKIRGNKKTKAWQDIRLSTLAAEMAKNAGLSLYFELENDPEYQREDQMEETDLSFLQGLCADAGASLKVSHDKIVIFSQEQREQETAILTVTPQMLSAWSFKSKANEVYGAAKVSYHDPETDEDFEFDYEAENANLSGSDRNDRTLVTNQRCKSLGEAENLAKNALRDRNKFEVTGTISGIGDTRVVAGVNLQMQGFGKFDGKYPVESVTHSLGASGYSVSASIRRALGAEGAKTDGPEPGYKDYSGYGKDFFE